MSLVICMTGIVPLWWLRGGGAGLNMLIIGEEWKFENTVIFRSGNKGVYI